MSIRSNQYGFPCKTYYYIVDELGRTFHHKDGKFRKKALMEMRTFWYQTEQAASDALINLSA